MRSSVIQLRQLVFKGIHLEPAEPTGEIAPDEAANGDFEGVVFRVNLGIETLEATEDNNSPNTFVVMLGISIDNTEGKPSPYLLDITALGLIEVHDQIEQDKRADLAAVNGASLIYGAIRELVTTLTARSVSGQFVLPTMDFRDHVSSIGETGQDS